MAGKKKEAPTPTEQVDQTQPEVQDQPEKDVFDEDDEEALQGPPKLSPGDPDAQNTPVASQDAPGDVPTQVKDKPTQTGDVDPGRVPGDSEKAANEGVLEKKGDLQPVQDQGPSEPFIYGDTGQIPQRGQVYDTNDPAFKEAVRNFLMAEMRKEGGGAGRAVSQIEPNQNPVPRLEVDGKPVAYKVNRGMVGAFPEGSIIPDLTVLGVTAKDLPRLLNDGVLTPYQPEDE